ncbi:MAG: CinA family nicotinamide mononucleotide deamidase-related protein [Nitriliruptoraceae bacterium]
MTTKVEVRADGIPLGAVLSVGSELLLGDLVDTNAAWVSRQLRDLGVDVVHHLAVRDNVDEIVGALRWLCRRAHLIVVGGGLGPTNDDLTREAIAAAARVELRSHDDLVDAIAARFARLNRTMPAQNLKQANIPDGANIFPPVGTAPAFAITLTSPSPTRVIALPGVPWELRELFARHVVDEVTRIAGQRVTVTRSVHIAGLGESDVAATVEPLVARHEGVTLAFLAHANEVEVRLTVSADVVDAARRRSQPVVDEVVTALGSAVAGVDDEQLEDVVVRLLRDRGQRLALAESATAGDIAARLGRVPGASHVLAGGLVVYSNRAKIDIGAIAPDMLAEHSAVSESVTAQLAANARKLLDADWGLAVTGVAGPEPVDDVPVGTIIWALAHPDGSTEVHQRRSPGDRAQVIARLGTAGLDLLRRRIANL